MSGALQRAWLRRGLPARLLWPVSQLYRLLAALHRSLYRAGLLQTHRASVPVIVIGNVVAGGAGKTPVVMATVEHLQARGLQVGVVSRGHGRSTSGCREVTAASRASETGDEPLLIAIHCKVPVFVASRRHKAARALLAAYPATQVLVCDDGLQHHALAREIEICVFDERGIGNGWLLPAGPLREPWPRRVDLVLRSGPANGIEGFALQRELAQQAVRADARRIDLAQLRQYPCVAVAGIARPGAFFKMLRDRGLQLREAIAFPDHYSFDSALRPADAGYSLICTEKDAVKLWQHHPEAWAVPLLVHIPAEFWRKLDLLLERTLSSVDGPETS